MDLPATLVVFAVEDQRYAIPLASARRVVFAAEVSRVAEGPSCLLGVVDVQGDLVPVLDIRRRSGARSPAVEVSDYFVLASSRIGTVALLADEVIGVVETAFLLGPPAPVSPSLERFGGAVRFDGHLVLIEDMEKFLTDQECLALEYAMAHAAEARPAQ